MHTEHPNRNPASVLNKRGQNTLTPELSWKYALGLCLNTFTGLDNKIQPNCTTTKLTEQYQATENKLILKKTAMIMCKLASGKNTNRSLAGNMGTCALAARQPCPPGCLAFLVWRDLRLSSSIDGQGLQLLAPHLFPYNSHVALSTTLWQEGLRQRHAMRIQDGTSWVQICNTS